MKDTLVKLCTIIGQTDQISAHDVRGVEDSAVFVTFLGEGAVQSVQRLPIES